MIWEELNQCLRDHGADLTGSAELTAAGSPLPFGAAAAVALPRELAAELVQGPSLAYWQAYEEINRRLDEMMLAAEALLKSRGFQAWAQTAKRVRRDETWATPLPHKTVAALAGLGWIGKNCLLVTPAYGCAVRLASLVTDAPLPAGGRMESRCGGCAACRDACPAGALTGTAWTPGTPREALLDRVACKTAQKEIMKARTGLDQGLCGLCFARCPVTRRYALTKAAGGDRI